MNYHNILHDDMMNGDGLRVVLFVSGCDHHCKNCQNPQTWNADSGIEFDLAAKEEIFEQLNKDYISGITFSGGDPLYEYNLDEVYALILEIKEKFQTKTIWLYSGYTWEQIMNYEPINTDDFDYIEESYIDGLYETRKEIVEQCDVFVDGRYIEVLADVNYHWCGSTNQRVIDVQKSLQEDKIVLHE